MAERTNDPDLDLVEPAEIELATQRTADTVHQPLPAVAARARLAERTFEDLTPGVLEDLRKPAARLR